MQIKLSALAVTTALLVLTACAPNYSNGERVGVVTKLSNKGLLWKSWEGSLNQGGTKNVPTKYGDNVVPNAEPFSVTDENVVEALKHAADTGRRVKVTYHEWLVSPVSIENSKVITAVTFLD